MPGESNVKVCDVVDLVQPLPCSFDTIGNMQREYHTVNDPNVAPVQHARRRVPIKYKAEIDKFDEVVCERVIMPEEPPHSGCPHLHTLKRLM